MIFFIICTYLRVSGSILAIYHTWPSDSQIIQCTKYACPFKLLENLQDHHYSIPININQIIVLTTQGHSPFVFLLERHVDTSYKFSTIYLVVPRLTYLVKII